jgi:hypothetical protein
LKSKLDAYKSVFGMRFGKRKHLKTAQKSNMLLENDPKLSNKMLEASSL